MKIKPAFTVNTYRQMFGRRMQIVWRLVSAAGKIVAVIHKEVR